MKYQETSSYLITAKYGRVSYIFAMVWDNAFGVKKEVLEKGFLKSYSPFVNLEKLIWQDIMKINLYQLTF